MTFGADIELFVVGESGLESAIPIVSGTKHDPLLCGKTMISHDNVAIEFAIPVCSTSEEVVFEVRDAFKHMRDIIGPKRRLIAKPSAIFPEHLLTDPEAQMFGCEPDTDVYNPREMHIAEPPNDGMRSIGAHQHFGHPWLLMGGGVNCIHAAKWLDATVGMLSVLTDPSRSARRRRSLYGQAGCIRYKPYGMEYRTNSPSGLIKSPDVLEHTFDIAKFALGLAMTHVNDGIATDFRVPFIEDNIERALGIDIRATINNCNYGDAARVAIFIEDQFGLGILDVAEEAAGQEEDIMEVWR